MVPESESVDYAIVDTDGTVDNDPMHSNIPSVAQTKDTAEKRLHALQMLNRMLQKQKRDQIAAGVHAKKKAKNRKNAKLAKASRKRNR